DHRVAAAVFGESLRIWRGPVLVDVPAGRLLEVHVARSRATGSVVALAAVLAPLFAVAYYAAIRSGNTVALVNPLLQQDELAHVLTAAGARIAVVPPAVADRLDGARLPSLAGTVVVTPGPDGVDELLRLRPAGRTSGRPRAPVPDEPAPLPFTRATTG